MKNLRTQKTRRIETSESEAQHQILQGGDVEKISNLLASAARRLDQDVEHLERSIESLVANEKLPPAERKATMVSADGARFMAEDFRRQAASAREAMDLLDRCDGIAFLNVQPPEDLDDDPSAAPSM